jgi:hypothetical protein
MRKTHIIFVFLFSLSLQVPAWAYASFQAHVFDSAGQPLANAQVTLEGKQNFWYRTVISGSDGSLSVTDLEADLYKVTAVHASGLSSQPFLMDLKDGAVSSQDIFLSPNLVVGLVDIGLFFVIDDGSDTPIEDLQVVLSGPSGLMADCTIAGLVEFSRLVSGNYSVSAKGGSQFQLSSLPLVVPASGAPNPAITIKLSVKAGDPALGIVSGVLRDPSGVPVSGAVVSLSGCEAGLTTQTGAGGAYVFTEVAACATSLSFSYQGAVIGTASTASAGGASSSSLRVSLPARAVPTAVAQSPAEKANRVPLVYRSQDKSRVFFDAGYGSKDLSIRIYSIKGEALASLAASSRGEVLSMLINQWGQGVYLAQVKYTSSDGHSVTQMQKFLVSR